MSIPAHNPRESSTDRVTGLVDSVKAYAIQETVGPIKGAGRWLAFGTLASLSMGLAVVLLGLGSLRLSQDIGGDTLDGAWSFVHYLAASVVLGVAVIIAVSRVRKDSLERNPA